MERVDRLASLLECAEGGAPDLVVCPELFQCGYGSGDAIRDLAEPSDGPFATAMASLARRFGTAFVYGYAERDPADTARIYNSAAFIHPDGTVGKGHRTIAMPYGYEAQYFTDGNGPTAVTLGDWRIGLLVCYDMEFTEPARALAKDGCHLIAAPTALAAEWGTVAHKMIPTRAFENNVFLAYSNWAGRDPVVDYLGASVICGVKGEDLARAGSDEELIRATLDPATIAPARDRLPYLRDSADGRHSLPPLDGN